MESIPKNRLFALHWLQPAALCYTFLMIKESAVTAFAPGKVILCGEHAVVYGQPAIALPVFREQAKAEVLLTPGKPFTIDLPDIGAAFTLAEAPAAEPLARVARLTLARLKVEPPPARLTIHSTIPIASGMGSGAAVATALVRALSRFLSVQLPPAEVSALVYEGERLWHGTPSGIDNTVIAYGRPVWFQKEAPPRPFHTAIPFTLVVADSGVAGVTKDAVAGVRRRWQADRVTYDGYFVAVGEVVREIYRRLTSGTLVGVGALLDENQRLLAAMGVSHPALEQLIAAGRAAGALGAKLCGAGLGGNCLALVEAERAEAVAAAMRRAGARRTIITRVESRQKEART